MGDFGGETLLVRACFLLADFAFRNDLTTRNRTSWSLLSMQNGLQPVIEVPDCSFQWNARSVGECLAIIEIGPPANGL